MVNHITGVMACLYYFAASCTCHCVLFCGMLQMPFIYHIPTSYKQHGPWLGACFMNSLRVRAVSSSLYFVSLLHYNLVKTTPAVVSAKYFHHVKVKFPYKIWVFCHFLPLFFHGTYPWSPGLDIQGLWNISCHILLVNMLNIQGGIKCCRLLNIKQAVTETNENSLYIGPWGTYFTEFLIELQIVFEGNAFENVVCNMAAIIFVQAEIVMIKNILDESTVAKIWDY